MKDAIAALLAFPWIQIHGPIEATFATTACTSSRVFPWIQIHGPIEARPIRCSGWSYRCKFPWIQIHGPIEA